MKQQPDRRSGDATAVEEATFTAGTVTVDETFEAGTAMSKNALKKLQRREKTLQGRKLKKLRAKEEKLAKAHAEGRDLEAEKKVLAERTAAGDGKLRRQELWDTEKLPLVQASFQICIDCAFESDMTAKEIASLASQIRCCYSYNKRSPHPCQVVVTSLGGTTLALLEKETGYSEWPHRAFTGTSQSLDEYYNNTNNDLHNVIYLTSDSEHTITELDPSQIYVIGGIVDRNRLKRAAMTRAAQLGIRTAKLPLETYLKAMPATRVLTCNHVFDILLKYRVLGNDWCAALRAVLPGRKEATFKDDINDDDDGNCCQPYDPPLEKMTKLQRIPAVQDERAGGHD
jgi:tRNA (guanine9-N1)-methyltransferase